jgi:hypothetical protein
MVEAGPQVCLITGRRHRPIAMGLMMQILRVSSHMADNVYSKRDTISNTWSNKLPKTHFKKVGCNVGS